MVLVVDDDADTRELLVELLRGEGALPIAARGVTEALEVLRTVVPDVVLTDFRMPGADGLELLRAIAVDPIQREIPRLLTSADDDPGGLAIAAAELGAQFLPKPFSLGEVVEAVRAAARGSAGSRR